MLELRESSGLHRGAALPVMEGRTSIGAGDDCGIVRLAPGIADRECVLVRHGGLTRPDGHARGPSVLRGMVRPIVGAVALLGFGSIAANVPALFSGSAQAVVALPAVPDRWTASAALARADTQPIVRAVSEPPPGGMYEPTRRDRADDERAGPSDLAGSAEFPLADDGERLRAGRVIARLSRQVPDAPPVTLRQASQAERLPVKVDPVMGGPSANVTIGAGRRLYVGDELAAWKLVAIESAEVMSQGQRRVEIDWWVRARESLPLATPPSAPRAAAAAPSGDESQSL
jgi:type III secretion protein D